MDHSPASQLLPNAADQSGIPAPADLRHLIVGDRVQGPLLVLEVEYRESARGGFTMLTFGNCHGRIASAPFWAEEQPRIAGIARGDVVQVAGQVGRYNGRRQIKVASIRVLPRGSIDWRRLLPSAGDVAPYWDTLDRWRAEIQRPRLRRTIDLFYADPDFRRRYEECPASTAGHHAQVGGLLRHTCEVASIGRAIAKSCRADHELVLAGALLHDIGKLEAYRWQGAFEITESGALLGHVSLGMLMLDRRIARESPSPCTERELTTLHHLIASHHGRQEFGAPVPPMTLEAEVLHFADNASTKTASMAEVLADPDNFAGEALVSAKSLWQIDRRRAFRGSSDWGADGGGG
jgi:3'-5' exoribonuclease